MASGSRRSFARIGDTALRRSPLQIVARTADVGVPVLAYHDVTDPDAFELQLRYVSAQCRPARLKDIVAGFNGKAMPPRSILVTFDDGDPSVFRIGLPLLRRYGIPAVAFVVTGLVGTTRMLWTKEVRRLIEQGAHLPGGALLDADATVRRLKTMDDGDRVSAIEGLRASAGALQPPAPLVEWVDLKAIDEEGLMTIEDHSFSHPQLDRCSSEGIRNEIDRSIEVFERELGRLPRAFAYPDGAWSDEAARVLESRGYEAAFLFDHRRARIPGGDRWGVSRLRVNSTTSLDRFATILSGLHPAIHHLRGRR